MKDPESRQEGESREDFARRISKFPTLHPSTILRVVFPTINQAKLGCIRDWARPVFPKAFPPTDRNGYPFVNPENISTKDFAKWVAEEKIFEAWIGAGQKVSPIAELFIELVNGKAIDSKQASTKVSHKSPHPGTKKAKMNRLREDYISAVEKMLIKNPNLRWPDFKDSPNLKNLIRESGLPHKESTLQRKWVPEARRLAKVKGTPGAPIKK
jgi:hypothetical protein